MKTRIGKKIGMALLGGSMALLIPFTAAAQGRDDNRFDRNDHQVQQRVVQQRVAQQRVVEQHVVEQHRQPVRVVERQDFRGRAPVSRNNAYEAGFRAGVNSRAGNGYYDSFGNWCAR